jgi:hypothetical protein
MLHAAVTEFYAWLFQIYCMLKLEIEQGVRVTFLISNGVTLAFPCHTLKHDVLNGACSLIGHVICPRLSLGQMMIALASLQVRHRPHYR